MAFAASTHIQMNMLHQQVVTQGQLYHRFIAQAARTHIQMNMLSSSKSHICGGGVSGGIRWHSADYKPQVSSLLCMPQLTTLCRYRRTLQKSDPTFHLLLVSWSPVKHTAADCLDLQAHFTAEVR